MLIPIGRLYNQKVVQICVGDIIHYLGVPVPENPYGGKFLPPHALFSFSLSYPRVYFLALEMREVLW